MNRRILALLPLILLSLVLFSCGSGTSDDQSGTTGTAAQTSTGDTGTSTDNGGVPTNPHGFGRDTTTPAGHSDIPTADQIKQDLIDSHSFIVDPRSGEWDFDSLPEFIDFTITSQDQTDGQVKFSVSMQLQDTNTKQFYNASATITYKQDNGLWVFSGVNGVFQNAGQEI